MRAIVWASILLAGCATPASEPPPPVASMDHGETAIFDAHRHAFTANMGAKSAAETLAEMHEAGIDRTALHFITREMYDGWADTQPDRFLKGVSFPCWRDARGEFFNCTWGDDGFPDIAWLRAEAQAGRLTHLGEMGFSYAGIDPADPRMTPYWALADEFGLPVMVHINRGPPPDNPMRKRGCCPDFDADLGNPERLRPVLERHPRLRIVLQHFGFPALPVFDDIGYVEESVRLMHDYPGVMAEMSTFHSVPFVPPKAHAAAVRRMKAEGLLDRLMFATDNWPAKPALDRYLALDFLTETERRAILHDNAARLFELD